MASNLDLYRRICSLKNTLELRDEEGMVVSKSNLDKSMKLVDRKRTK